MNRIVFPLLTLGLSLTPLLCWAAEPKPDEAKAIAEIEKLGGKGKGPCPSGRREKLLIAVGPRSAIARRSSQSAHA